MNVNGMVWAITLIAIAAIFVADFLIMGRRPHVVGMKEAALTAGFYVLLAVLFGGGIWFFAGAQFGTEFLAGSVTELSLSAVLRARLHRRQTHPARCP